LRGIATSSTAILIDPSVWDRRKRHFLPLLLAHVYTCVGASPLVLPLLYFSFLSFSIFLFILSLFSASTCKCSYHSRVMVRSISTGHFLFTSNVMIYHYFLQAPISVIGCFFNVGTVQSKCSDVTSLIIFLNVGPKKDFSLLLQESKRQLKAGRAKCRRYRRKA
jgi:hypothetical protein